ncbi:putative inactive tRNA-specific adenosine deaminase-like protein 3 [Lasioglossum baleicum]|uniref:putative inactive tRNA-specific adenosine deaminase-like protein 3 n=1 Tax=Lasioglossum baleicum TaxID=434251 RepID=UPI003FCEBA03
MATTSTKRSKEEKTEKARSWLAKPILSSEFTDGPPLEDVYAGLLKQKKDISTAIQKISAILPGFNHLKRCSGNKLLLSPLKSAKLLDSVGSPSEEDPLTQDDLKTMLKDKGFDLALLEDDFQIIKVPSRPARTKSQAARVSKIWPLNFHSDPTVERLIDGSIFTEQHLDLIEEYMSVAVEAARLESVGNEICNGSAVIVDPEDGRILAIAASRIDLHPMWHAAMLAVDLVAKLHGGGAWKLIKDTDQSLNTDQEDNEDYTEREKRIKRKYVEEAPLRFPESLSSLRLPMGEPLKSNVVRPGRRNNGSKINSEGLGKAEADSEKSGPYLCTGYWSFLLKEPCPLCAMALVHSRISRIFYGVPNEATGVLGSKTILHAVPGLNHRYQVWSGVLEQECRQASQEIERRNVD